MILDISNKNLLEDFSNFNVTSEKSAKEKDILTHTYIDGTVQVGEYINDDGQIVVGSKDAGNGAFQPIYGDYPKDKGFVKKDEKGRYFYFKPLPAFKMAEIKKMEDERARREAENKKNAEKQRIERINAEKLEKDKLELKLKEASENRRLAEIDSKNKAQQFAVQTKNKNRKIILASASVLLLGLGIYLFKKFKK